MTVPNRERERRDWTLIVFIIPLGIILIIIVGQLAIRLFPNWSVNADMHSNLDPNSAPGQPASLLQPLLPQILTQMAWADTYLTPSGDSVFFPPFIVLEPTATPTISPTPSPTTPSPTATTPSPTTTITPTSTPTTPPPAVCEDSNASNYGGPLPCVYPPPPTCQDTNASNYGGPLPCVYPPTCQDTNASNYGGPLPCIYPTPTGYPSTIEPSYTLVSSPPQLGVNTLPDNSIGLIVDGNYVVLSLSVVVEPTPDANYDIAFYEFSNAGYVYMDWMIIGISHDPTGAVYYEVFNWGANNAPDTNSNVDTNVITPDPACTAPDPEAPECDNHLTELSDLHDPDGAGPAPQTGVLIDVDNASSQPPPGTYNYIVIIAPIGGSAGEPVEIDSIEVTEIPIPTPTP